MTDGDLDPRRLHELRAYAERGVRPIHADAIAEAATGQRARRATPRAWSWLTPAERGASAPRRPVLPTPRIATRTAAAGLAIGAAALAVIVVAANSLTPSTVVVGVPQPSATATPAPTVWPSRSPTAGDDLPGPGGLSASRHSAAAGGVPFSFAVPAPHWDPFGTFLLSKSIEGPQGAEAIVFWAAFPDDADADPCINAPLERWDAADAAVAIATADGTRLVDGPTDVAVGGHPAKHVVVVVRKYTGCDPGFFYNWKAQTGGSLWVRSELGDTIAVWIVEVDGQLLFIAGEVHQDLAPGVPLTADGKARLEQEIQAIVDSIRFD